MSEGVTIHPTAVVHGDAAIGEGSAVWHFCHIREGAQIGKRCTLGQNVYVAPTARIGDGVKIQNQVSVYDGVVLEDHVFVGPSAVFSNVKTPRSEVDRSDAFESTRVSEGASIGANATVVCGVTIGRYAMVGAGAVVADDVKAYARVVGVAARWVGWSCRCGISLEQAEDRRWWCAECGGRYVEVDGGLEVLENHDE